MTSHATNSLATSLASNERIEISQSPYHPSNLMRTKLLKAQILNIETTQDKKIKIITNIYDLEHDWRFIETEDHISVHQSFNWCRAWCNNHKVKPIFVTVSINSRIEFILPLEVQSQFGIKRARLIGSDHSNVNFLLASKAFLYQMKPDFIEELKIELRKLSLPFDAIHLEKMRLSFVGVPNPFGSVTKVLNQNASFQLPLQSTVEKTFAQINAKRKRKMVRSTAKKLGAIGEQSYIISNSIAENEKIISAFFLQKAKRFESKGLPDAFGTKDIQDFFADLCALDQGDIGKLELHAITLRQKDQASEVVAIAAVTVKNGHAICQFSSFNEDIAAQTQTSPGEFLFYHVIENMVQRGMRLFDFGIGDQPYKHSWCTIRTEHYDGFIALNTSGYIAAWLETLKIAIKRKIKSSPQFLKLVNRFRR